MKRLLIAIRGNGVMEKGTMRTGWLGDGRLVANGYNNRVKYPERIFDMTNAKQPRQEPSASKNEAYGNAEKDPKDWVTGDEPMTGAQASYIKTLSEEANEPTQPELTKAEASQKIEELQEATGRGKA